MVGMRMSFEFRRFGFGLAFSDFLHRGFVSVVDVRERGSILNTNGRV